MAEEGNCPYATSFVHMLLQGRASDHGMHDEWGGCFVRQRSIPPPPPPDDTLEARPDPIVHARNPAVRCVARGLLNKVSASPKARETYTHKCGNMPRYYCVTCWLERRRSLQDWPCMTTHVALSRKQHAQGTEPASTNDSKMQGCIWPRALHLLRRPDQH